MIDECIVKSCLEQRVVLADKMLEITCQMEVQANLDDIELDSAFSQRTNCMERIDKCNKLLNLQLADSNESDKQIWKLIINGNSNTTANAYEQDCAELAREYHRLIANISEKNAQISHTLHERHEQSKEFLRDARNAVVRNSRSTTAGAGSAMMPGNMFY